MFVNVDYDKIKARNCNTVSLLTVLEKFYSLFDTIIVSTLFLSIAFSVTISYSVK